MRRKFFFSLILGAASFAANVSYADEDHAQRIYRGKMIFLDDGAFFKEARANPEPIPIRVCSSTGAFKALPEGDIGQVLSVLFEGKQADDDGQSMRTRCIIDVYRFIEAKE